MQRTLTYFIVLSFVISFGIFENDLNSTGKGFDPGNGFGVFENGLDDVKKGWVYLDEVFGSFVKKRLGGINEGVSVFRWFMGLGDIGFNLFDGFWKTFRVFLVDLVNVLTEM